MVIACGVEVGVVFTPQDICAKGFAERGITPQGTTSYIGHASINNYSGGLGGHLNSDYQKVGICAAQSAQRRRAKQRG